MGEMFISYDRYNT